MKKLAQAVAIGAAVVALPAAASAAPAFAVWLDGNTTPGGGGNAILNSLGAGNFQLVSTANLETAGFLNPFKAIVVSRFGDNFGTGLSAAAAANVQAFVGSGPTQGAVALFTNDMADNLAGSLSGDPFDANLQKLFTNAASFAAASGHGYIGEFNGAAMGVASNANGFAALDLLPGSASALPGSIAPEKFVYDVGPIGGGHAIDQGVTFPFTDDDVTTFLTKISGASSSNIVDIYTNPSALNDPAILANEKAIEGVPEPASLCLLGIALVGMAAIRRRKNI